MTGQPLSGAIFDLVKCFDRVPRTLLRELSRLMGIDPGIARFLAAFQDNLRLRFKLAGGFGSSWQAVTGNPQGDPISMLMLNVLVVVWAHEMDKVGFEPQAFADNLEIKSSASDHT